jgi:hypothetical protein
LAGRLRGSAEAEEEGAEAERALARFEREEEGKDTHVFGLVSPTLACAKPATKVWCPGIAFGSTDAETWVSPS